MERIEKDNRRERQWDRREQKVSLYGFWWSRHYIAAPSPLAASRWKYYISVQSVGSAHLPLSSWFSSRIPIKAVATSFSSWVHVSDYDLRRPLRWSFLRQVVLPSVEDHSLLTRLRSGTAYRKWSVLQHAWHFSRNCWRQNCSHDHSPASWTTNCINTTWLTVIFCSVIQKSFDFTSR